MTYNQLTTDRFVDKAKTIHGDKFDYSLVNYVNNYTKVTIICPKHGKFQQRPSGHLGGKGCFDCQYDLLRELKVKSLEDFIRQANQKFNNKFDYSKVIYRNARTKIEIVCPCHGAFFQTPTNHLSIASSHGCNKCGSEEGGEKNKMSFDNFLVKAAVVHNGKYEYDRSSYIKVNDKIKATCPKHGDFSQYGTNHLKGFGCPSCSIGKSYLEEYIDAFLVGHHIDFVKRNRNIIKPWELDFFIPNKNIAIECNGVYWHSELLGKQRKYHLTKLELCQKRQIRLIQIMGTEINYKPKIVMSRLRNILGLQKYKIFGRKCCVDEITKEQKTSFLNKYHLQGDSKSSINLGLFYKHRLVAVMTFGQLRVALGQRPQKENYELIRFAGNFHFSVFGGASKLLSFFERKYFPLRIISYADKRWSKGDLYNKLGFQRIRDSAPNYWYFNLKEDRTIKLYHRFNFRKNVLSKKLAVFDPGLSEWENMRKNGWNRIWDCGNIVFEKRYVTRETKSA